MNNLPITNDQASWLIIFLAASVAGLTAGLFPLIRFYISERRLDRKLKLNLQNDAEKMFAHAREESLEIINSAHEQAREIISQSETLSSQVKEMAHEAMEKVIAEKGNELTSSVDKLDRDFLLALETTQSKYIERYKKTVENIDKIADEQIAKLRDFFEAQTSSSNQTLESMTTDGIKVIQNNLKDYEVQQKIRLNDTLYQVLQKACEQILGSAIPLEKQEELVMNSLEEAKKLHAIATETKP